MSKILIIMSFIYILFTGCVYGEDNSSNNGDVIIPPGMEVIKEGDVNVVVPKGGQLRKQGSVMMIETADEYAARRFEDTDNRFIRIEKELESQKKEVESQKKELEKLRDAAKKPEEDGRKK